MQIVIIINLSSFKMRSASIIFAALLSLAFGAPQNLGLSSNLGLNNNVGLSRNLGLSNNVGLPKWVGLDSDLGLTNNLGLSRSLNLNGNGFSNNGRNGLFGLGQLNNIFGR